MPEPYNVDGAGWGRLDAVVVTVNTMFDQRERDAVRRRLLDLASEDPGISGAAITGSLATGGGDRWSDIDLAFAVAGQLGETIERWTARLYGEFGAIHHWDLPAGSAIYRVFLLPDCLEVDIGFTPESDFGAGGPQWRLVFGAAKPVPGGTSPTADGLAGLAWHHALHAYVCTQRGRWWQAEHWISGVRDHVLALAALRLGHPTSYAKGAHLLPAEVTAPLTAALVRSLDVAELQRALAAAVDALVDELRRCDPRLADRLAPTLQRLAAGSA